MATEIHIEEIISMMKQQMTQMMKLQEENNQLRAAGETPSSPTEENTTVKKKTKTPRPNVEANIDDRELKLFKDSWCRYKTITNLNNRGY